MSSSADDILRSPRWYTAGTLSVRAALATVPVARVAAAAPQPADRERRERAARLFARWQAQSPFAADGFFARRLAADGLSADDLLALLAEPAESLAAAAGAEGPAGARPAWLDDIEDAFRAPRRHGFPFAETIGASRQGRLLEIVRPLLDLGWERLLAALEAVAAADAEPLFEPLAAARLFAGALPSRLLFLLGRTLAVELNIAAQAAAADAEGDAAVLAGTTPEERFASFLAHFRDDPNEALALLCRYPVLARQVTETVGRWVAASSETLRHLVADAPRLRRELSPTAPLGTLADLRTGLGDAHRGGRTVTLLRFDSGLALIYKPRSMGVEATFQDLLDWIGARGFSPAFRRLGVVDAGDHGWAEVVAAAPCGGAEEIERFYQRQGGYLALLFALSGTDMHHENLIAAGEHPMLVDLEALFHPLDQRWGGTAAWTPLPNTVLNVGFLPTSAWGGADGKDGVDLSGLAAVAGQVMGQPVLQVEGSGTDRMRFLHKTAEVPIGEHRPTLAGAEVDLAQYVGAITAGFDRMLRLLAAHREALLAPGGPLAAFADKQIRVLVRLSMAYAGLLTDGQHPFVLGDALERDRLLDHLWTIATEHPALANLIAAEQRDLLGGDIPVFTALAGSRDVRASDGETVVARLDGTGLERVAERLRGLDEAEIARQRWIVRNSLGGAIGARRAAPRYELQEEPDGSSPSQEEPDGSSPSQVELPACSSVSSAAEAASDRCLAAAHEAGRYLESLAFHSGRSAIWFGPNVQGSSPRWVVAPTGPDLHLGCAGIALFLAHLGAVSGDRRVTELARAATFTMREQSAPDSPLLGSTIGAFAGWGGVVYTLTHLGVLWGDEALLDEAERAAESLAPHIAADRASDLVAGAAGCLVCLLGLWARRPTDRTLDLAVRCGERLLAQAQPAGPGLGWVLEIAGPRPLAGFSHGAAGIAWALLQLAEATGDGRYRQAALDGLAYERSVFSIAEQNWPDLRAGGLPGAPALIDRPADPPELPAPSNRPADMPGAPAAGAGEHFMCTWCHGAAGIALGRLDSLARVEGAARAAMRAEAEIAVRTTLAAGFGKGHCLCHGDLGNLEVLTLAAERLERADLAVRRDRLAAAVVDDIRRNGWRCGLATQAEAPGLLLGVAGIGHGLLRLAAPRRVPSVLRLAPPPPASPPPPPPTTD